MLILGVCGILHNTKLDYFMKENSLKRIQELYLKIERTLGSAQFAVAIILLFALALILGTFAESYHGTSYAQRFIYKSWWFMSLQLLMFLSVLVATILRLPFKKRLYGFYVLHLGILLIFAGSFVTYWAGIDGVLDLRKNNPNQKVDLTAEDILEVSFTGDKKKGILRLPYTSSETDLNLSYRKIKVLKYLPFAKLQTEWVKENSPQEYSASYRISNPNVTQDFTLSLSPESDYQSGKKMGLLSLHLMPKALAGCFNRARESGILLWNIQKGECFSAEERGLEVKKTPKGTRFVLFETEDEILRFFPDFSPTPLNDDLTNKEDSIYRVFSLNLFKEKANLFLFGSKIAYFDKKGQRWISDNFENKNLISLPWMNFKLRLLRLENNAYPIERPVYMKPIQDSGKIVEGELKAVLVEIAGHKYWITDRRPLLMQAKDRKLQIMLKNDSITLPYKLALDRFHMKKNPGTNTPASYESFVSLFDPRNTTASSEHHIYMNNPLKYDDLTFYQSSYYQVAPNEFASVLSVNYDPGRPIKYFGSLILVLGSLWHFIINRKKKKK